MKENFSSNTYSTVTKKPVVLKKKSNKDTTISYVVIPSNEEEIKNINANSELPDNVLFYLKDHKIITFNNEIEVVIYAGKTSEFKKYDSLVYKFPQRKRDILERKPAVYRNYLNTFKQQVDMMWLVGQYMDSPHKSWNTVKTIVKDYCIIIKTRKINVSI